MASQGTTTTTTTQTSQTIMAVCWKSLPSCWVRGQSSAYFTVSNEPSPSWSGKKYNQHLWEYHCINGISTGPIPVQNAKLLVMNRIIIFTMIWKLWMMPIYPLLLSLMRGGVRVFSTRMRHSCLDISLLLSSLVMDSILVILSLDKYLLLKQKVICPSNKSYGCSCLSYVVFFTHIILILQVHLLWPNLSFLSSDRRALIGGGKFDKNGDDNHTSIYTSPSIPYGRSTHPLDVSLSLLSLRQIIQKCNLSSSTVLIQSSHDPAVTFLVRDLHILIWHDGCINDDTIECFTYLLHNNSPSILFLKPQFSSILNNEKDLPFGVFSIPQDDVLDHTGQ